MVIILAIRIYKVTLLMPCVCHDFKLWYIRLLHKVSMALLRSIYEGTLDKLIVYKGLKQVDALHNPCIFIAVPIRAFLF